MTPREAIKRIKDFGLYHAIGDHSHSMRTVEAFKMAINALEQQDKSRWIPCSEKLPEYGAEVLTINTDGDYEINHIIDEEDAEWFYNGAIAWTPLPEPYKEDNNDTTGSNRQG